MRARKFRPTVDRLDTRLLMDGKGGSGAAPGWPGSTMNPWPANYLPGDEIDVTKIFPIYGESTPSTPSPKWSPGTWVVPILWFDGNHNGSGWESGGVVGPGTDPTNGPGPWANN